MGCSRLESSASSSGRRCPRCSGRVRGGTGSGLALAHGSNDAQDTIGLFAAAVVASGVNGPFVVPLIGRVFCTMSPVDGLVSQGPSTG